MTALSHAKRNNKLHKITHCRLSWRQRECTRLKHYTHKLVYNGLTSKDNSNVVSSAWNEARQYSSILDLIWICWIIDKPQMGIASMGWSVHLWARMWTLWGQAWLKCSLKLLLSLATTASSSKWFQSVNDCGKKEFLLPVIESQTDVVSFTVWSSYQSITQRV